MAHQVGHTRQKSNGKTEKWNGERWVEQTQPIKNLKNLINKSKLFVKNKLNQNSYKSTGKGNQHLNFNKPEGKKDYNPKFASFRKSDEDQAKLNKQVANKEKVTYKRVHNKEDKAKYSDQHKVKSKDTPKTKKRMSSIEKKNRARLGDARVDKLKAKQVDFKKMRKGGMSKADFIKKYPKSITAQKAKGLR